MANLKAQDVRHIAKLARLKIEDWEVEKFTRELTSILDYVNILNELDTTSVEPTAQVTGITNILRKDEVRVSEATKDELLGCSPLPIVNDQIETFSAHEKA